MARNKNETNVEKDLQEGENLNNEEVGSFEDFIDRARKAAFKTRIVTVTSNDKRDSNTDTTVIVTSENQFFGLTKVVPLNIPVELEQCLIDTLKEVRIPLHVPEMVNGRQTGNSILSQTNKYNISYEE